MKVFLSSTVEGLRDARLSFIERMERTCEGRVTVVCYERNAHQYPTMPPEETCLALVRECGVLVVLIDQYYGMPCKSLPEISITHAEVREAFKLGLTVIPVVRTQAWHEYFVWRANPGGSIVFAHVKEQQVFRILDELYSRCNCHVYDNLTGNEAMTQIAASLDAVISRGCTGTIHHVALAAEPTVVSNTPAHGVVGQISTFSEGQMLYPDDLNALYQAIIDVGLKHGLTMNAAVVWRTGDFLTASQLNILLDDVVKIYKHIGRSPPEWSFGRFGQVLRPSHLNEIVENLRSL